MATNKIVQRFTNRISVVAMIAAVIAVVVSATVLMSANAQAAGPRPFYGGASGTFTGPDSGVGTVIATHLGKGSVSFSGFVLGEVPTSVEGPIVCLPVESGDQTFTAANGDELIQEYIGGNFCIDVSNDPPSPHHGDFILDVVGGTGRFDGATGTINIDALAGDNFTWSSVFTEGSQIDY